MLGSGTSSGVPRLGPDWGRCDPADPRNRRTRVSLLVETADARVLVDTGPDFREQMLRIGLRSVDAVLYTHDHADHTHGIDDLRQMYHALGRPVATYADLRTLAVLRRRFDYVFEGRGGYPATATIEPVPDVLRIASLSVRPFEQVHGDILSLGFRFEADGAAVVYSTDISAMTSDAWTAVRGSDLWIVDALRRHPHPSHSHLDQTLDWIVQARPRRAWLTHMDNSMDYKTLAIELPDGVEPGHDGLSIELRA